MLLLFVVLLWVYPMKFLFSLIADQLFWTVSPDAGRSAAEVRQLVVTYRWGVIAVNAVFL